MVQGIEGMRATFARATLARATLARATFARLTPAKAKPAVPSGIGHVASSIVAGKTIAMIEADCDGWGQARRFKQE
jgi:hypothetical protein